jgi:hypothetical protein
VFDRDFLCIGDLLIQKKLLYFKENSIEGDKVLRENYPLEYGNLKNLNAEVKERLRANSKETEVSSKSGSGVSSIEKEASYNTGSCPTIGSD